MKHLEKRLAACVVLAAGLPSLPTALDRFVVSGGGNVAPYTNWAGAATSIQAAIDASSSGDCIWVSNGTYVSSGPSTNASMLYIDKAITIKSWSGAASTIIDGGYPLVTNRCLYVSNSNALIEGFTIRNGCASGGPPSGRGGGVYIEGGGTIRNCLIAGNSGDGIRFVVDNSPFGSPIYNCTIAGNSGDGIFMNYLTVGVDVRNCIITGNGGYGLRQNPSNGHSWMTVAYSDIYGNTLGAMCTRVADDKINVSTGVVSCAPQFVASGDYRLSASSACVGRGEDLYKAGVTMDIDGRRRLGAFDLGCYESVYSAPAGLAQVYVDASAADDLGDGSSWATAKKTIGSGLAFTATGGVCRVAQGSYSDTIILPRLVTVEGAAQGVCVTSSWYVAACPETNSCIRGLQLAGGSYQLSEASPCVDSGTDAGISVDAAGRPRPIVGRKPLVGSGFDMGCYELVPRIKGSVFVMR